MVLPEEAARVRIDAALEAADWRVQDLGQLNLGAGRGTAVREFPLAPGHGEADYLLYVDGRAVGAVEAKKGGATLTGVEPQSPRYAAGLPDHLPAPIALKAAGAKDWHSGLGISLAHQGRLHYIQFHHIFPKSILKERYEKSEINEIANMAFISGQTNRRLSNQEPAKYFPRIVEAHGQEALASQAIPRDSELLAVDRYRDFLAARGVELARLMNEHLEAAQG